jgi:membrane fusion protein, multidrug efflux system
MAQKPSVQGLEREITGEPLRPTRGADAGAETIGGIAARLYEDHLVLRREVTRLHEEVEKLREDRLDLEEEIADESDEERRSLPFRIAGWTRRRPLAALIVVLLIALAFPVGTRAWAYFHSYETTDDAQVDGHIDPISSRISGTVLHVYVEDNDHVQAGQLLADIDPRDYEVALEQAHAQYEQAKAQVATAESDYDTAVARVNAARATNNKAQHDAGRYSILSRSGVASAEQYEEAFATAKVDSATVAALNAAAESAAKERAAREANVSAAKAALDQAQLNLSYTRITAPVAGVVGKRSAEPGQRIDPGQELLAIVRVNDLWVTANFKETQLSRIRRGEPVSIHVDTFNNEFKGYVESLAGASGDKYSLLPPENATGNYVKIVQRIPVRIRLDPQQDIEDHLRPGMSVEATVWLR